MRRIVSGRAAIHSRASATGRSSGHSVSAVEKGLASQLDKSPAGAEGGFGEEEVKAAVFSPDNPGLGVVLPDGGFDLIQCAGIDGIGLVNDDQVACPELRLDDGQVAEEFDQFGGGDDGDDGAQLESGGEAVVGHQLADGLGVGGAAGLDDDRIEWTFPVVAEHLFPHGAEKVTGFAFAEETASDNALGRGASRRKGLAIDAGFGELVDQKNQPPIRVAFSQPSQQGRLAAAEKPGDEDNGDFIGSGHAMSLGASYDYI